MPFNPIMLSPPLLWLITGVILCGMELIFPTAFVEFMMGVAALIVALCALIVPQFSLQVLLWLIFSTLLIVLSRRMFTPSYKASRVIEEDKEGQTLTAIPPGETGRVLYEGNSWSAKCGDEKLAIASHKPVYIIGRKGNTLIVMPTAVVLNPTDPE
ncbi:NfeD family protein [Spirulina subsalsa FACHB-351]|uniref:NfeD family protein n=1 Tax=Spirulina subsalsa FACHB-351 TaxID=234711 RepID=A0ABT3L7N1_9CYAN|nr:NfeD family protein [Spirulina subsalsa]MCW6037528.1 NfeD family protein [Spirulina subsalsa FACHB-351]